MTEFAARSHPGLKRDHNEDCYRADPQAGLWLVADGVGGHAHGDVAARIVGDTIPARLRRGDSLLDSILAAHVAVLEEIACRESSDMGSTVVALHLQGDSYEIGWVGDSRAYLYDGELRQLTRDHSLVSELLARGAIAPEQAASHPQRHVLSQSLGISASNRVSPGLVRGTLEPGQQIILCSDGLTDELRDTAIAARLAAGKTCDEQVWSLVGAALDSGGRDNVTVVVVGAADTAGDNATRAGQGDMSPRKPVPGKGGLERRAVALASIAGMLAVLWALLKIF